MFLSGFVVFLAVFFLLLKLPRRIFLMALAHGSVLDLGVTVITLVIHFGTFSGVMAATVAGVLTSMSTTTLKRSIGYIRGGRYHPGFFSLKV